MWADWHLFQSIIFSYSRDSDLLQQFELFSKLFHICEHQVINCHKQMENLMKEFLQFSVNNKKSSSISETEIQDFKFCFR